MRTIPFDQAIELLDNYLLADELYLVEPEIAPDRKSFKVEIGNNRCIFEEFNNKTVRVEYDPFLLNSLRLEDTDGNIWHFQILKVAPLDLE